MTLGRGAWKGVAIGVGVAAILVAVRLLPLREWMVQLEGLVRGLGPAGMVLYGAVYVAAVVLFVPGIVLTLGAGFLFGLGWGIVVVSIASAIAAGLAFLIARYLARGAVERLARKNPKFAAIDRAIWKGRWEGIALLAISPPAPLCLSNYIY